MQLLNMLLAASAATELTLAVPMLDAPTSTSTSTLTSSFAAAATCPPQLPGSGNDRTCLTASQAQAVMDTWTGIFHAYNQTIVDNFVSPTIQVYSGGIDSAQGTDLDAPTWVNRTTFSAGVQSEPPLNFKFKEVHAYTCDTVVFRYGFTVGKGIGTIAGIDIIQVNYSGNESQGIRGFLATEAFIEFNVIQWLAEAGVTAPPAPAR